MRTFLTAMASMEVPGGLRLSSHHAVAQGTAGICGDYAAAYTAPLLCSWASDVDVQVTAGQCAVVSVRSVAMGEPLQVPSAAPVVALTVSEFQVCRDASGHPTVSPA